MYPSHDGGLVSFQRYITSRKRTEEELVKTRAELAHVTRITTMASWSPRLRTRSTSRSERS